MRATPATRSGPVARDPRRPPGRARSHQRRTDRRGLVTGYDLDTNRTSQAAHPASNGTTCSDATTATSSASHTYNTGDQVTDTGYAYDAFGRTTSVPAAALTGTGAMSVGYFSDDMVHTKTQNGATDTFTLDPLHNRIYTEQQGVAGPTSTNHYNDGSDSPSWTDNGDGSWTRDVTGLDGNLAASQTSTVTVTLELPDLHGDIGATAANSASATGVSATYAYTEFGNPETGTTPPVEYGSLGAKQRSTQDLGGLSLMGERLYDASSGRFLQTDPIAGGSSTRYDYCDADPINCTDIQGTSSWWHRWQKLVQRGCDDFKDVMCTPDTQRLLLENRRGIGKFSHLFGNLGASIADRVAYEGLLNQRGRNWAVGWSVQVSHDKNYFRWTLRVKTPWRRHTNLYNGPWRATGKLNQQQ